MKIVGLTGGIACGKSTVRKLFQMCKVHCVDADQISRDVVQPGTVGFERVVDAFGTDILTPEETIDRRALGDIVFADQQKLQLLESIVVPLAMEEAHKRLAAGTGMYAIFESATLIERGDLRMFDALIVVKTSPETQLRRLMARNGFNEAQARQRIAAQMPVEEKVKWANFVVDNNDEDPEHQQLYVDVIHIHSILSEGYKWPTRSPTT
jgi:dephospho-CoA kinase